MKEYGDLVVGQTCPRCRRETVVYNGNYFCTLCDWAMGEAGRPRRIQQAYLVQCYRQAEAVGDEAEMHRFATYLRELT